MDPDERLRWLETRITSSCKPRADDLRRLFSRDESRATLLEFFSNDDAHKLFVYFTIEEGGTGGALKVSLSPPVAVREKCICFMKTGLASQLHSGNLDDSITCMDWTEPITYSDMLLREVFLPLLCTDCEAVTQPNDDVATITQDKLMDVLHRLLGNIEIMRGISEGRVCLPLPSIEVLAEAAAFQHRQPAVVHVLESAVIGWIKQIRNVLSHDPLSSARSLSKGAKEPVRPHHEVSMWEQHIEHLTSILEQLEGQIATDILANLKHANSSYAQSFDTVRIEVERALENSRSRLRCFTTVLPWIQDMYRTSSLDRMLKVFSPLLHTVLLIWKHSDYYHSVRVFSHLLHMLSNEVVARARSLVGDNPFEDTSRSYTALKDALRLCAAFRGTYLDFKETANMINEKNLESNVASMTRLRPKDHNVLFRAKMYGPTGFHQLPGDPQVDGSEEHWDDSAWPPRNTTCFGGLSRFVERCNDLLDLVETTRHFHTLEEAARVGGAGSSALDALVNDIHQVFMKTIKEFTKKNQDVLTIDDKQHFEKAFFHYRSVIKTLERRLAGVLRKSLSICPNPMSHLRVLEVFEGISARELLQKDLATENEHLVTELIKEFKSVKKLFQKSVKDVPKHSNMPPTVSKLFWIRALKERIGVPMGKIRAVCPHALESDKGWLLRDAFTETMNELEKYETKLLSSWNRSIDVEIRGRLKNFILAPEEDLVMEKPIEQKIIDEDVKNEFPETSDANMDMSTPRERASAIKVNLDQKLLVILRDIKYLRDPPYEVPIPASVRALLRTVDSSVLHRQATRLHTVVSKYNHIIKSLKQHELLLFEGKMRRVDELIQEGKEVVTWGSSDLEDYLEKVTAVISEDVHRSLTRVHNNWVAVEELAHSWSKGELGIFTSHKTRSSTHDLKELLTLQEEMDQQYRTKLIPAAAEIHSLLQDSFEAIEMSAASPAWRLYTAQMDAIVLIALKNSILTSLDSMYTITAAATEEGRSQNLEPILTIRLELVEQTVSFSPPMDRSASVDNVEDAIGKWLNNYLKRASLVNRLTDPSSTYSDFLSNDEDVWEILNEIQMVVMDNGSECKQLLSIFDNYRFLWVQDVQQSFQDFLNGRPSPNPLRASKQSHLKTQKITSQLTGETGQRSRYSATSPDAITEAERAFLTPHRTAAGARTGSMATGHQGQGKRQMAFTSSSDTGMESAIPGLAEFDEEIGIYKSARDNIASLPDFQVVGWLNINFQPIKQVLTTYASKWMWTFTKYLCDQVTDSLDTLADFLARTEPEIESITGEERDTASFMKMMRLFNEVSAQQQDMEERFSVMHRTVHLLEKYDMKLSTETQQMFDSAPDRWNHLKTKVSLAKQRLGPRIQEESARITHDLLRFGDRVTALSSELRSSEVFSRECPIHTAMEAIDGFTRRLRLLQTEAQDLIELQELLETAVVNFSALPQYQRDLKNLKITWEQKRMCEAEQRDWKLKHWQKIDTKHLQQATRRQKELIQSLPPEVAAWDVYHGMIESVIVIEQCLPLVEDLNHPAMRTRHWKQLVRVTGGLLQTDTDSLRKMILGDLLELGLQKHAEEVKAIVQRAVKDLTIESSLKTCEEVWLGKIFDLHPHTRGLSRAQSAEIEAGSEVTGSELIPHAVLQTYEGSRTTGGTRTKSMKSGPHSRSSDKTGPGSVSRGRGGGRTSVLSLPISLVNLVDDPSPICLLKNVEKIFAELEHHQIELNRMQSNSAIGSFLDEVTKWQKKLQLVEAVLEAWISVQEKWVQLDDIYSGADVRTALAHEANMFAVMSKDFRLLMRATEKNTNVLQSCSRKGLLPMLEKMDTKMEQCRHALLGNLERRRQRFPRLYFLSPEDVMNIVCYGYDLIAVNKYLCKIFPNLGKLDFEEQEPPPTAMSNTLKPPSPQIAKSRPAQKTFLVKGITSTSGECTVLSKPLPYEGPMSQWLPRLIDSIKFTLQEKLHTALGFEPRPAQIERDVRSAGASKIRVSRPSSAASHRSGGSNKSVKPTEMGRVLQTVKEGPSDMAIQLSRSVGVSVPVEEVTWTLDNSTQIALLATSVKISQDFAEAVKTGERTSDCFQVIHEKIQAKLDGAVIMLKGMEDEKTTRMRSARFKTTRPKEKAGDASGAKRDGTAYSESIGAPSTRSLLEDDMDMGGDEGSIDEGMGGDPAPVNTMQSLLFTEQLQAGGKGGRRETLDIDLGEILPQIQTEQSSATMDARLSLFPSQIHKIAGLIMLMVQYRDTCQIFMKSSDNIDQSFEYLASLHHIYNEENMEVSVHMLSWVFEYGYEYQGSCMRYIISPTCDRVILSMCHALHTKSGVLLSRQSRKDSITSRSETLDELSSQMGRALYTVLCSSSVDHYMLGDIFKGLAETGCWLCLDGISNFSGGILSVAGQLANAVLQALRSGQTSLVLQSEEVAVNPMAAFFATVDHSTTHLPPTPMFSPLPTAVAQLPPEFLKNYRIVSASSPDRRPVLEIRLLAQGFTQASEISHKLCILLQLVDSFFWTLPCHTVKKGAVENAPDTNVMSLHIMELLIASAGSSLDALIYDQMEKNKEHKEMIFNKTHKFAELWKYKASTSGSRSILMVDSVGDTDGGITAASSDQKQTKEAETANERAELEADIEAMRKLEEEAVVTALRNHILSRMLQIPDRNLLITLIQDLWSDVDVDFGKDNEEEQKYETLDDWGPDINTEISIPVHQPELSGHQFQAKQTSRGPTSDVESAITAAVSAKRFYPSPPFIAKVAQLTDLAEAMKAVIVTGRPGSGKSACVNIYAESQRMLGVNVSCKRIFLNALDSTKQLFGYYDPDNREWKDGLVQHLIRPLCFENAKVDEDPSLNVQAFILHVDGILDPGNTDIFLQLLRTSGPIGARGEPNPSTVILPNNERLRLPAYLHIMWEMESLAHLPPNVAAELGVLAVCNTEITWKVHLSHWLNQLPEAMQEILGDLLDLYLPKIIAYFSKGTLPDHLMSSHSGLEQPRLRQSVKVGIEASTITFCRLLSCLLNSTLSSNVSQDECERYVGYALFWAFGGTLEMDSRDPFAIWWKEQWPNLFPVHHDPWYVFVDSETSEFAHWADHIPQFSGFAHAGGQSSSGLSNQSSQDEQQRQQQQDEVFVHTPGSGQMNHLLGMLTDAGHPVMIAGPTGCGKTAIVRERVNTVSSGEVAEVLSLFIHCNRLTQAGGLWERVSNYLEWKHGITYIPRGNKKLLCVVDDLNLSKPLELNTRNGVQLQSACEIIRQHLDTGGIRNISSFKWQQVSNVTYVATTNPNLACSSCQQSQRLTRHFSVFSYPFPSVSAQKSIFNAMVSSHFLHTYGTSTPSGSNAAEIWAEKPMEHLLHNITMVTIELQEKLRSMYLSVPDRAHYLFTMNDLDRIFRNLLISLRKDCHQKDLLLLWRHECNWTYGWRMISDVDMERYHQAFDTAVRKYLTENKYLPFILPTKQHLFSSVRELDSGFVTAGRHEGRSSQASRSLKSGSTQEHGDYYSSVSDEDEVHRLLTEAVKEYNKVNVGMNLSLYKDAITMICRLARILQCPHKTGHTLLFGDGCPMIARLLVNLAAHLGGFSVRSLRPAVATTEEDVIDTDEARLAHFKQFMVNLYNQTGVKGEKIVLFFSDDRVLTHECFAVLGELIRHGAISHLFTTDEQTTIANSVRSEVTAAGLTYSRDAAWNFFQSTVMKNLRIVLVCADTGKSLMAKSLEFPALFNHLNMIAMRPWSHEQLVEVTLYHIQKVDNNGKIKCLLLGEDDKDKRFQQYKRRQRRPLDKKWMENVAHLLANMHIAVRQKAENKFYKLPGHVSNYAFEKLIQRFVSVFCARRRAIHSNHNATAEALMNIDKENAIAESLQRELDRERQVLEEHRMGTAQLLAQIGQDMVITEQQVLAVKQQIRKIRHLKKSQPEYKHAHEKAVFKAAAIVADMKKVVKEIDHQGLAELRALQKPDNDVEDLMACIIMIVKSPNSDLTWSKGAKRQMANLDRFIDELMNFDDSPLPQSTLDCLEPTLEKETFTVENLTVKAGGNAAAGALLRWVQGVVRYHSLMISKVKPLHDKLEETSSAIVGAQHRLRQLESKKEALEFRLRDLAEGFEQATVDKNEQENKRLEMQEHLREAAHFQQVLMDEHRRRALGLEACEDQLEWVIGVAAISAGFVTYMGPYPYMFRRMLLTVDWAQCLVERGIPLVFDTIDPVRGHRIEFMLDVHNGIPELSEPQEEEEEEQEDEREGTPEMLTEVKEEHEVQSDEKEDDESKQHSSNAVTDNNTAVNLPLVTEEAADEEQENDKEKRNSTGGSKPDGSVRKDKEQESESRPSTTVAVPAYSYATLPFMSTEEYQVFVGSIVKVLVGEEMMQEWLTKDYSHHQLQNAVILQTSWQRPPLLLDPYLAGVDWYASVYCQDRKIVPVNLSPRTGQSQVMVMEKAILAGHTLMLMDCEQQPGNLLRPLIYHANMTRVADENPIDETRTIRWLGRRLVCPDSFRLCMSTAQPVSSLHPNIIAASQLVSYIPSAETLQEDLLNRALSRVRPEVFHARKHVMQAIRQHRRTLSQLNEVLNKKLVTETGSHQIESSTKFISSVVDLKAQVFAELKVVENLLSMLNELAEELFPIAQRSALLYTVCRALPALDPHYQIPLPFFLHLFDTAVGTDTDDDGDEDFTLGDVKVVKPYAQRETADGEKISIPTLEKSVSQERRRSKLRLGSATKAMRSRRKEGALSGDENSEGTVESDTSREKGDGKPSAEEEDSEEELARKRAHYEIVIPTVGQLPTEGVEYGSFSGEELKKIVDAVTTRVFEHIFHSVQPEHRLHVASLTLLNIELDTPMRQERESDPQEEEQDKKEDSPANSDNKVLFSEEELTLLIHGNPGFGGGMSLSLKDFECQAPVPTWMPADHWEDILALSVLPGPLEGICIQVAECADAWKEWYECPKPEVTHLPPKSNILEEDEKLSDFHKLLLIRTLRPDRLMPGFENYVSTHIVGTSMKETFLSSGGPDREMMFKDITNTLGVLICLPDQHDPEIQATLPMDSVDAIRKLGENCNVNVTVATIGDGCQPEVTHAIEQAHADDSWLVINGLHLAPRKFFEDLQLHLARIGNISRQSEVLGDVENADASGSAGVKKAKAPRFLVWLTTRPSLNLPPTLTQYLYKLSWKSLIHIALNTEKEITDPPVSSIFKKSLINTMEKIPEEVVKLVSESQLSSISVLYAICVCHSMALSEQCFGWYGLSRRYPLSDAVLYQAITHLGSELEISHCITLIKILYNDVITCRQDRIFMDLLLEDVLSQALSSPDISKLLVHGVEIPVPPASLSANDYTKWLISEVPDDAECAKLLSIHPSAVEWKTTLRSQKLLEQLQDLFTAAQQPGYETSVAVANLDEKQSEVPLTLLSLQTSLEMCSEQLPALLELGGGHTELLMEYEFPYHRPSVLSSGIPNENPLPEPISFVLMKECIWFNHLLCHVYQQLHQLKRVLMLTADYKLSQSLKNTAKALLAEDVPESWVHPNDIPSSHTLLTWLSDMNMRYKQFRSWIREGLVPNTSNSPVGKLSSVWLGGLVNPQSLITAMCHEKAVTQDTTIEMVKLKCKILPEQYGEDLINQQPNIILKAMLATNMLFDVDKECLVPMPAMNKEIAELPLLYLYAVLDDEEESCKEEQKEFPVYMNASRQVFLFHLPLPADSTCLVRSGVLDASMHHASVVLQTGLNAAKRDLCKTRTYLARKRREEWDKVSPEISELMSRSATRLSSTHQSVSAGYPMSVASLAVSGQQGNPSSIISRRDSITGSIKLLKKGRREASIASSGEHLPLEAASKAKSSSQISLSSHASTMPPPSLTNKPPSRVQEEREDDNNGDDEENKPLPNGRIIHKETPVLEPASEVRPSSGVADAPPGTDEAVQRGALPAGFFDIKQPPSTDASLLQSLMDEDDQDETGTDAEQGGSDETHPSVHPSQEDD